jgi:scyllo-inositol 2-dehydrogenase (NADP+)
METRVLKVGIAGLGRSGWSIHAGLLALLPEHYQVQAVVDADPSRRNEATARFGCTTHTHYEDLLSNSELDIIVVALPSNLHTAATLAALEAGKHVVCEKPMATSLEDADRMITAAAASDHVLTVFHQRRYNPEFRKVQEIIASGLLGRIVQIRITSSNFSRRWDWQTLQKFGGGALNNTGPHFLDQALLLFGPAEPEVFCQLDRTLTLGDADDHVKIILSAPESPTVDVEISSCCAYPGETWNIMGTEGGLRGTTSRLDWKWIPPVEMPPRQLDLQPTPDRSYNRDKFTWHEDSWEFTGSMEEAHAGFYRDLYQTIVHGAPLAITPESVRRVMWLQEHCHQRSPLPQDVY